jgi:hypothetical protein
MMYSIAPPHEDWYERAKQLKTAAVRLANVEGLFPVIPEVPVSENEGRYFVSTWDVHSHEVPCNFGAGSLIQIGEDVYEIQGRIESLRLYYMRRFELTCPDTVRTCFPPKKRRRKT